jgi:hypothetical protein
MLDTRAGSVGGAARSACAPAIGKIHFPCDDGGCQVDVVTVDGPFEVTISASELGPFQSRAMVDTGAVYLRAKYEGTGFPAPSEPTSLGKLYLAVASAANMQTFPLNVDLAISNELTTNCQPATLANNFAMICAP